MGGAALKKENREYLMKSFNRRGDSLGGAALKKENREYLMKSFNRRGDSLGGAARSSLLKVILRFCFNRRGDSLGGAAIFFAYIFQAIIRFQSQGRFFGGCCGVNDTGTLEEMLGFNRRGDSLGGAAPICLLSS